MRNVDVCVQDIDLPKWGDRCSIFAEKALRAADNGPHEISIVLCSKHFIQELNRTYRGKDEPTDVLSFPQYEEGEERAGPTGDIVIAIEAVAENAREFGVEMEEEIKRVIIHGILHLLGWDHSDNSPQQPMLQLQEKILGDLKGERVL